MSMRPVSALMGFDLLAHELHAVVVRRIVAGGDHDAAVEAYGEGGEVDALGAAEADVVDVDARIGEAADQRVAELVAREADVAADADAFGLEEGRVGLADLVGEVFVEFGGDASADVVGFEGGEGGHGGSLPQTPAGFQSELLVNDRKRRRPAETTVAGAPQNGARCAPASSCRRMSQRTRQGEVVPASAHSSTGTWDWNRSTRQLHLAKLEGHASDPSG